VDIMFCPKCGSELPQGASACRKCGAVLPGEPAYKAAAQEPAATPKISRLALASLILGILILSPLLGLLFGIAALILGAVALIRITASRGKLIGKEMAACGIILGMLGILLFPFIFSMHRPIISKLPQSIVRPLVRFTGMGMLLYGDGPGVRSKVSQARSDMRAIATALEAYFVDNMHYPAWAKGDQGANAFAGPHAGAYHIHTFRIWRDEGERGIFRTLTTPIPYLPSYLRDPFASTRGAYYGYYCDLNGWVLYSWGPDMDENQRNKWDLEPDVETAYRSVFAQPTLTLLAGTSSLSGEAYTYDPTNGTISPGDIYRVKQ
jgi:hypothetical protein